ncbi:MAG: hypothetical protein U1D55_04665 [Phycisphaerae bacterium]
MAQTRCKVQIRAVCPLAASVYDVAAELGIRTLVADTTQDAWTWRAVKRKTDRDDALKLLRLAAVNQLNPVHVPTPVMRQWRALIQAREAIVVADALQGPDPGAAAACGQRSETRQERLDAGQPGSPAAMHATAAGKVDAGLRRKLDRSRGRSRTAIGRSPSVRMGLVA